MIKDPESKIQTEICDRKFFFPEVSGELIKFQELTEIILYHVRLQTELPIIAKIDLPNIQSFKMRLFDEKLTEQGLDGARKDIHYITGNGDMERLNPKKVFRNNRDPGYFLE